MADEKKPIPVGPQEKSEPIRVSGTTLASLLGSSVAPKVSTADTIKMTASAAGHDRFMDHVLTGTKANMALNSVRPTPPLRTATDKTPIPELFAKGQTVYDAERNEWSVITRHAGFTTKGKPIYKLINRNGDAWLQKANKLKKR